MARGPFPAGNCFACVGREIAGSLSKSVRHGIFMTYDHIHLFQWSVLLGEFYLFIFSFIVFNDFPLCITDPNNSGMWIGNDKAEFLQFSHNNDLCILQG